MLEKNFTTVTKNGEAVRVSVYSGITYVQVTILRHPWLRLILGKYKTTETKMYELKDAEIG